MTTSPQPHLSPTPPAPRGKGRGLRRVFTVVGGLLAGVTVWALCMGASALLHLQTHKGRSMVRNLLQRTVSDSIQGTLEVQSVDALGLAWPSLLHPLGLGTFQVRGVHVWSPEGLLVLSAQRVRAVPRAVRWSFGEDGERPAQLEFVLGALSIEGAHIALGRPRGASDEGAVGGDLPWPLVRALTPVEHGTSSVAMDVGFEIAHVRVEGSTLLWHMDESTPARVHRWTDVHLQGELRVDAEMDQTRLHMGVHHLRGDNRTVLGEWSRIRGRSLELRIPGEGPTRATGRVSVYARGNHRDLSLKPQSQPTDETLPPVRQVMAAWFRMGHALRAHVHLRDAPVRWVDSVTASIGGTDPADRDSMGVGIVGGGVTGWGHVRQRLDQVNRGRARAWLRSGLGPLSLSATWGAPAVVTGGSKKHHDPTPPDLSGTDIRIYAPWLQVPLTLQTALGVAPELQRDPMGVQGSLEVGMRDAPRGSLASPRVTAQLDRLQWGKVHQAGTHLRARFTESTHSGGTQVSLDQLSTHSKERRVVASGGVAIDWRDSEDGAPVKYRNLALNVDAQLFDLRHERQLWNETLTRMDISIPRNVAGRAKVRGKLSSPQGRAVGFVGEASVQSLRWEDLQAGHVRLGLTAHAPRLGAVNSTQLQVGAVLDADAVRVDPSLIQHMEGTWNGSLRESIWTLGIRHDGHQLQAKGEFDTPTHGAGFTNVHVQELRAQLAGKQPWVGQGQLQISPAGAVTFSKTRATSGWTAGNRVQSVDLAGTYAPQGTTDLAVDMQDLEVGSLVPSASGEAPITGRLNGDIRARADVDGFSLVAEGELQSGHMGPTPLEARYLVEVDPTSMVVEGRFDFGAAGQVDVESSMLWSERVPTLPELDFLQLLENAYHTGSMELTHTDLQVLGRLWQDHRARSGHHALKGPQIVTGLANGTLSWEGLWVAPELSFDLVGERVRLLGDKPFDVRAGFQYSSGALSTQWTALEGPRMLAQLEGSIWTDLTSLLADPETALGSLPDTPWKVSAKVPPSRLSQLPWSSVLAGLHAGAVVEPTEPALGDGRLDPRFGDPMVEVNASLSGGALAPRGDVQARVAWNHVGARCGAETDGVEPGHPLRRDNVRAPMALTLHGELRGETTRFTVRGFDRKQPLGQVTFAVPTPLQQWMKQGQLPGSVPVALTADLNATRTEELPWACEILTGPFRAQLRGADLGTPDAQLNYRAHGLLRSTERLPLAVDGTVNPVGLLGEARIGTGDPTSKGGRLHWNVPWLSLTATEQTSSSSVLLGAQVSALPLSLITEWLPDYRGSQGLMDADLQVRGSLVAPEFVGTASIHQGTVLVDGLGQPLRQVDGRARFEGSNVTIEKLVTREGDGRVLMNGNMQLRGWNPSSARVHVVTHQFPIQDEGSLMATATGDVDASIRWKPSTGNPGSGVQDLHAQIRVNSMDLALPTQPSRTIQGLAPHPDVTLVDHKRAQEQVGMTQVRVLTREPVWVHRSDFKARVGLDLDVIHNGELWTFEGAAHLSEGTFSVVGKEFHIDRGTMTFTRTGGLDPMVDLAATHTLRSISSTEVTMRVTGLLSDPRVEFQSNHPDCNTQDTIVTMLLSDYCGAQDDLISADEAGAAGETRRMLSGVLAGLLTMTAQGELGAVVPNLVVEQSGAGHSTRIRAGFRADSVIPKALRRVVQGVYVEGALVTQGPDDHASDARLLPGFLVQLLFPQHFVSTGTFDPPDSWSVDLTWEP